MNIFKTFKMIFHDNAKNISKITLIIKNNCENIKKSNERKQFETMTKFEIRHFLKKYEFVFFFLYKREIHLMKKKHCVTIEMNRTQKNK